MHEVVQELPRFFFLGLTLSIALFHACKWKPVRMIERLPQAALITVWQPSSSVEARWAENLTEQQHLPHCLHVTRGERRRGFNWLQLDGLKLQQHGVRRFSVTAERRTSLGIYDDVSRKLKRDWFYLWPSP